MFGGLHLHIEGSDAPRPAGVTSNTSRPADGALRSESYIGWLRPRHHSMMSGVDGDFPTLVLSRASGSPALTRHHRRSVDEEIDPSHQSLSRSFVNFSVFDGKESEQNGELEIEKERMLEKRGEIMALFYGEIT